MILIDGTVHKTVNALPRDIHTIGICDVETQFNVINRVEFILTYDRKLVNFEYEPDLKKYIDDLMYEYKKQPHVKELRIAVITPSNLRIANIVLNILQLYLNAKHYIDLRSYDLVQALDLSKSLGFDTSDLIKYTYNG